MSRATRTLAGIHAVGSALLFWLAYYWLGLGEARTTTLLWSAIVAVVVFCLACWLECATLVYFGVEPGIKAAFRRALKALAPFCVAVLVIAAVYLLLSRWADGLLDLAFRIASWLTLKLRKPVKPASVFRPFSIALWLVRWVLIPIVVLPWLASIATGGWRSLRRRVRRGRVYWLQAPVLMLAAVWLPLRMVYWVPHVHSFAMEMSSFIVRLLAAYALFIAAWLVLLRVTSAGQSPMKTVSEPRP